jgi:signal transduction histidine kinase
VGLIRGFRGNIFITFATSLSLAMVLILLVVTSYYRKARLGQMEAVVDAFLWQVASPLGQGSHPINNSEAFWNKIHTGNLSHRSLPIANLLLLKKDGALSTRHADHPEQMMDRFRSELIAVTLAQQPVKRPIGSQWVFPGRIARYLLVARPLKPASAFKAAAVLVDLQPLKKEIVKLNNLMLSYFSVNLVVFTLIGGYRLNRIYMRPIQRMVKRAEEFREEDGFLFAARRSDDEINHLSKSLNLLLSRISEDKRQLQRTVTELEVANANLEQAQNEVVRAETLASVGRLASGVAHEIGNPLGIVLGYLDLLGNPDIPSENRKEFLRRTEAEVQRINSIIRQLLDLSRPSDTGVDLVHLHAILKDTVAIISPQPLMKQIDIKTRLTAAHDGVLAAPEQLRQVFLNLILNAADAIASQEDGTGEIRIRSQLIANSDLPAYPEGEVVELTIEDDGPGIPPDLADHIFEPFFTTKAVGQGTGLGLSVSYMIIESLKGQLTAASLKGGGTCMRIRLPLYKGEATTATV